MIIFITFKNFFPGSSLNLGLGCWLLFLSTVCLKVSLVASCWTRQPGARGSPRRWPGWRSPCPRAGCSSAPGSRSPGTTTLQYNQKRLFQTLFLQTFLKHILGIYSWTRKKLFLLSIVPLWVLLSQTWDWQNQTEFFICIHYIFSKKLAWFHKQKTSPWDLSTCISTSILSSSNSK